MITVEDKPYGNGNNERIKGIITVTNTETGESCHKEWKQFPDGYCDREEVIEMLTSIVSTR